jgi:hypothetical protein
LAREAEANAAWASYRWLSPLAVCPPPNPALGAGMICPHIVNWSMLLGAILSWGFMWPLLAKREGDWYPAGLGPHDFQGLFGYKVGADQSRARLTRNQPQAQAARRAGVRVRRGCCRVAALTRRPRPRALRQVFLVISILMGEGLYMVLRVLVSCEPRGSAAP